MNIREYGFTKNIIGEDWEFCVKYINKEVLPNIQKFSEWFDIRISKYESRPHPSSRY